MIAWPTHLLVCGEPSDDPGPLHGHVPHWTGCGLKLHNKTWRGWETRAGELSVDASPAKEAVTCKRCLRSRAWASAKTGSALQKMYSEQTA